MSSKKWAVAYNLPKLSKADYQLMLDGLTTLLRSALCGDLRQPRLGICTNWRYCCADQVQDYTYPFVEYAASRWVHTCKPGQWASYPVPEIPAFGLWEGPNLVLRLDLIAYLRKRLRDLKRRAKD